MHSLTKASARMAAALALLSLPHAFGQVTKVAPATEYRSTLNQPLPSRELLSPLALAAASTTSKGCVTGEGEAEDFLQKNNVNIETFDECTFSSDRLIWMVTGEKAKIDSSIKALDDICMRTGGMVISPESDTSVHQGCSYPQDLR